MDSGRGLIDQSLCGRVSSFAFSFMIVSTRLAGLGRRSEHRRSQKRGQRSGNSFRSAARKTASSLFPRLKRRVPTAGGLQNTGRQRICVSFSHRNVRGHKVPNNFCPNMAIKSELLARASDDRMGKCPMRLDTRCFRYFPARHCPMVQLRAQDGRL